MRRMNFQNGGIRDMLSRDQMRLIIGGYDPSGGTNCAIKKTCKFTANTNDLDGTCDTNNATNGCHYECECVDKGTGTRYDLYDLTCGTR
jgi:hypothetical protein